MMRPDHLPDYSQPPLDEVVLGVQFASVPKYASVHAKGVWDLFRADFPKVQEHSVLEPQFETFGGTNQQAGLQFIVGEPPAGSRLWFVSEDENHLVQFQPDRFITNWRRQPNTQPYPHFDGLSKLMEAQLRRLAEHLESNFTYKININQAEVAYINIIPVKDFSQAEKWFRIWAGSFDLEGLSVSFGQIIRSTDGMPYARLTHQLQSVFTVDGKQKAFRLSLTFKGKPEGNGIDAAMKFLASGRDAIVTRFSEITTSEAHSVWGRIK